MRGLGFAREPRQAVGVVRERTIELRVAGAEDLSHPALAYTCGLLLWQVEAQGHARSQQT